MLPSGNNRLRGLEMVFKIVNRFIDSERQALSAGWANAPARPPKAETEFNP
jgi:hypothetical protein